MVKIVKISKEEASRRLGDVPDEKLATDLSKAGSRSQASQAVAQRIAFLESKT